MKYLTKLAMLGMVMLLAFGVATAEPKIKVATNPGFVPFEFKENGKYVGFDIDLWSALAKEMQVDYEWSYMNFDGLVPALQSGNIDVSLAGMTITDERKKVVNFSEPYFRTGLIIMVSSNNNSIKQLSDLEGKVVAVQGGTVAVDFLKNNVKTKEVRIFPQIDNAYMELGIGRSDAVVYDTANILYYIKTKGGEKFKTVGESMEVEGYGIAVTKRKPELAAKIDAALKTLRSSGVYAAIYQKWFGRQSN